ncbi:MAG: flagellar hook capping FlgD N-terminal domain-containing protein [Thermoflexaceae bacterium]|nr:flagellar hook capping FlgD N-terminal domain-containing protein [Thermoflexaceae bacterium]
MAVTQAIDSDGNLVEKTNYYNSTKSESKSNDTLDKNAFLNLLVAEMKYQDPLEPTSNTEYIAQLATFSQVESIQNMQVTAQQQQGANLAGKPVIMKTESSTGETGYICGRVDYMVTEDSKVYLSINGSLYDIEDLDTVLEEDYYQNVVLAKENGTNTSDKTDDEKDATDNVDTEEEN